MPIARPAANQLWLPNARSSNDAARASPLSGTCRTQCRVRKWASRLVPRISFAHCFRRSLSRCLAPSFLAALEA